MSQSHSLFEAYQAVYTPQEQDDYQLVLDYLVSEGYVDDADEAELVIEQLEDDVIDGILDEVKGCGGKVNPDNGDYENGSGSSRMMMSPRKKALAMARRKENEATTPQHQRQAAKMRRVASNMKEELDEANRAEREFKLNDSEKLAARNTSSAYFRVSPKDPTSPNRIRAKGSLHAADQEKRQKTHKEKRGIREELDTYDLVLDYLLSEGFADNEEAALQIMSNMSEEWMEEAVSHYVNS